MLERLNVAEYYERETYRMRRQSAQSGLLYWMEAVSAAVRKPLSKLDSKTVHDLRVSLRRCRSMGDGFRQIDPDKRWKKMRRQGADLFDSLGGLRDIHVMQEWVEKFRATDDDATEKLLAYTTDQEHIHEQNAAQAIHQFDLKQWNSLATFLSRRSTRMRPGSGAFQSLALERWTTARKLQKVALRTGNPTAFHRLRIAIKKFRYLVENFLPRHKDEWARSLKEVQDLLGEIHDLDVLWETGERIGAFQVLASRQRWEGLIRHEREVRIEQYKTLISGSHSLWNLWRSGLPRGEEARRASLMKLQAWSGFLDSDIRHSRRVARFALRLYDGLNRFHVIKPEHAKSRELLQAAAMVHEVGRSDHKGNHHKRTERMVQEMNHLPGWSHRELEMMARIARYHRGALPAGDSFHGFLPEQRRTATLLSGILRLANALDAEHDGAIHGITVSRSDGFVVISADGLQPQSSLAETIAGARYLLEVSCGLPIMVQPARPAKPGPAAHKAQGVTQRKHGRLKMLS